MPYKNSEEQKAAQRAWYLRKKSDPELHAKRTATTRAHHEKVRQQRIADGLHRSIASTNRLTNRAAVQTMIAEAKAQGCIRCPETDPPALDFHHLDPKTKSFGVAFGKGREYPAELVKIEIEKCVVLCKNCHSKLHAGRFSL